VTCALALLATPREAQAQARDWKPDTHRSGAGAELYVWDQAFFGTNFPIIGFANIEAVETFFIDVYLPFTSATGGFPDDRARAGLGNPTVAFRYAPTHGIARWWIGGGIGAPLGAVDDDHWRLALGGAFITTALYDSHLWATDAVPGHVTGGVDVRAADFMSIQAEAKISPWIAIGRREEIEVVLQNRFGLEFRHPRLGIGGGVHAKLVWFPREVPLVRDRAQLSLEPHFAYTNEVFFVRLGVLHALDGPLGVFDDNEDFEVISGHLTLGGSWD
jgi:hypothetical protein